MKALGWCEPWWIFLATHCCYAAWRPMFLVADTRLLFVGAEFTLEPV